ncbi:MAG: RIO-like serine/threonine protein kinase fused to N-terminal HTH domain protein [Halonotius sp. J07HN6]|nr:MAG: RIO-like serine/threonine protein kinase fused to N-terminal HTH domain protein [Halonotius sp. J07HN6]
MVDNIAGFFRDLEDADFYLLSGLEQGMRFSEWVQHDEIPKYAELTPEEVDYRLDRCMRHELIERKTIQYEGYQLTFEGYDALALRTFAERDTIDGVGAPLGVGKESDVYEVQSFRPMALKYHREGYTNFREVAREREYTADRDHVSWLYTARQAAETEFEALETLYPDVSVPRPVEQNRHAIVMEKLTGAELSYAELESAQVVGVLELILDEAAAAYDAGYVHADLSEYNIFVDDDGITIFDWPQAVATDHENARELLARDIENVYSYFRRKYPNETPESVDLDALADDIVSDEFGSISAYIE